MFKLLLQKKQKTIFWILITILGLSLFLRFYNLHNTYVFNLDEEYQATYAWTIVQHFHRIWIGVSASFLDFYLGPYFTYLTALFLKISHGDPVLTAYIAALFGVVTVAAVFVVGWKYFGLFVGIIASLLYAGLPIFIFFDQKYWNPMFVPLTTLFLFISLNLIKKSKWWWVLFAATTGSMFETHLGPAPLLIIGLFYFVYGKYYKDLKLVIFSFLAFLAFYWPLVMFDYYHNFSNITVFARFAKQSKESKTVFDPAAKFRSLSDSLGRFWYLKPGNPNADEINFGCTSLSKTTGYEVIDRYASRTYSSVWLSALSLFLLVIFFWLGFKSKNYPFRLLTIFLLVSGGFYLLYPGGSFEYYALGFLTLFTFVPAILIGKLNKKLQIAASALIFASVIFGVNTILKTSDEFSLGPKKELISKVMAIVGDKNFSIDGEGICHNYEGWRYLFRVYGRLPTHSYTDRVFAWLYMNELNKDPVDYEVILAEDRIPKPRDLSGYTKVIAGGYAAYIRKL